MDATEPHLRIPAEYRCRPCEQRKAVDSTGIGATKDDSVGTGVAEETRKKKEKEGERKEKRIVREKKGKGMVGYGREKEGKSHCLERLQFLPLPANVTSLLSVPPASQLSFSSTTMQLL